MPTWEARATRGTVPAERVEDELRYALVAPLLADAALWVDLGCGTAAAAAAAQAQAPAAVLLVDLEADALAEARAALLAEDVTTLQADLSTAEGVAAVRAGIEHADADPARPALVTCFGVLHQLEDFTHLVELLLGLAKRATVVLSVPDDAAGAHDDPQRRSAWSAGAAEELRRLLPAGAVSLRQVAVHASAIVPDAVGERAPLSSVPVPAGQAATHHLLAFGPGAGRLAPASLARVADVNAERADLRRRESDLAYLEARVAQLEATAG